MKKPIRALSLGWGVQSWALAAMAALGEIEPIDVAVHADTTHEASGTYAHARKWTPWLEEHGVKVATVYPKNGQVIENGKSVMIPAYTTDNEGHRGQIRRQCTNHWKIQPVRRYVRSLLTGRPPPGDVHLIMGISLDEALRMKDSNVAYVLHKYPLVEQRISRTDCIDWLKQNNLDVPPKSSCVFCPYRSRVTWGDIKRSGGYDWEHALETDIAIRDIKPKDNEGKMFLHPFRKPLEEAVSIPEDIGAKQLMLGDEDPTCDSGFCFT